jgi:DNA-binding response OmpR family regulator
MRSGQGAEVKVLIIEDDSSIVDFMQTAFQIGWPEMRVETAGDGAAGLAAAGKIDPDIILLDLGLPDMNGFDVLKSIRLFSKAPIIIVTVSGEENYVVRGLALGANDYMIKPIRPLELIARMKSLLKKRVILQDLDISCGNLHFGVSLKELFKGNKNIGLTDTEGRLLYALMKNPGAVVSYAELSAEIWGDSDASYNTNLKVHVRHLRQKVEDNPSRPKLIINRPAVGYLLAKNR